MNHFSWLDDMKKQAADKKATEAKRVGYVTNTVRGRYLGNTGPGNDGTVDPSMPTHMISTNMGRRMIHEGEDVYVGPNKELTVIPANSDQNKLKQIEQREGVMGYAGGINVSPRDRNGTPSGPSSSSTITVQPRDRSAGAPPSTPAPAPETTTGYVAPITFNKTTPLATAIAPQAAPATTTGYAPPITVDKQAAPAVTNIAPQVATTGNTSAFVPNPTIDKQTTPAPIKIAPQTGTGGTPPATGNAGSAQNNENAYRSTAMGRIAATAQGNFSPSNAANQKALDDLKATLDTQQMQQRQEAAQGGLSPEQAAARQAMGRAQGNQAMAGAEANIATEKLREQAAAQSELASQSLAGQQFQEGQKEFQQNLAERQSEFGQTFEENKSEFQKNFEAQQDQQKFNNQLSQAQTLMSTNDPSNIQQAAKIYEGLFPGTSFNTSQIISDVGAARYAQDVKDMGTLATTFKSWDDAKSSAAGLNLIKDLGGDAAAQSLFNSVQVNTIDQDWNTVKSSKFYQALSPDNQKLISDLMVAKLTGSMDFSTATKYDIKDSNGNTVQTFNTQLEADNFLKSNPNSGYTIKSGDKLVPIDSSINASSNSSITNTDSISNTNSKDYYSPISDYLTKMDINNTSLGTLSKEFSSSHAQLDDGYKTEVAQNIKNLIAPDSTNQEFVNSINWLQSNVNDAYKGQIFGLQNSINSLSNSPDWQAAAKKYLKDIGYNDSEISSMGDVQIPTIMPKSSVEKLTKEGFNQDQIIQLGKLNSFLRDNNLYAWGLTNTLTST